MWCGGLLENLEMTIPCPCKDKCSGYRLTFQPNCELVEECKTIPDRFKIRQGEMLAEHAIEGEGHPLAKLLSAMAGGWLLSKVDDVVDSYEVWRCPDCRCEICYAIQQTDSSKKRTNIAEIASCGKPRRRR